MYPNKKGALPSCNLRQKQKGFLVAGGGLAGHDLLLTQSGVTKAIMRTKPKPVYPFNDEKEFCVHKMRQIVRMHNESHLESTILVSTAVDLLFCLVFVNLFFLRAEPLPFRPVAGLTTPSAAGVTFEIGASFRMRVGVFCFTGGLLQSKSKMCDTE